MAKMSTKSGQALERVVAHLERILINDPTVTISMRRRFPDLVTGRPREHDVVLEFVNNHHTDLVALECRDRSRPVTVNAIESFAKKCEHTGVSRGIIVSSKGFYKSAKAKAKFLKIGCFTLEQVTALTTGNLRMVGSVMEFITQNITSVRFNIVQADEKPRIPEQCKLVVDDGRVIPMQNLKKVAINTFNGLHPDNVPPGLHQRRFFLPHDGLLIEEVATGDRTPVLRLEAIVDYEVRLEEVPYEYFNYSDTANNCDLGSFAIARGNVAGKKVGILMASGKDGSSVHLIADEIKQ